MAETSRRRRKKVDGGCPICGRPTVPRYRPFCSARCAHLDLGRWLNGDYRIPAEEPAELDETPPEEEA